MTDPLTADVCTYCGRLLKASELGSCSECKREGERVEREQIDERKHMNPQLEKQPKSE